MKDSCPRSVIPVTDGLLGLAALTLCWCVVLFFELSGPFAVPLITMAVAIPMLAAELARAIPSQTLATETPSQHLDVLRTILLVVVVGMAIHGASMGLVHWSIAWILAAPVFALRYLIEWRRNGGPRFRGVPLGNVWTSDDWATARLWALKAFFIPLYCLSLAGLVASANANDLLMKLVVFAYAIDLSFGLAGYIFASNNLVPTIRSTQRRPIGWLVCVLCYGPIFYFWPDFKRVVHTEISWPGLIGPGDLFIACALIVSLVLYVSATVAFGLRFSNLTNRGVITTGPYRLMKHPAYFAHVSNAWLITLLLEPGWQGWLVPIAFTILYWARAITEEQHLREDPQYRAYEAWIDQHGIFRMLKSVRRAASSRMVASPDHGV